MIFSNRYIGGCNSSGVLRIVLLGLGIMSLAGCATADPTYELVISGGRVMDPETELDAIQNIGVSSGEIVKISDAPLQGQKYIDASGLVVAPGFIDLHAHGQDPFTYRLHALDGVTSSLEMEEGVFPVVAWYRHREGKAPINFGATVSHSLSRALAFGVIDLSDLQVQKYGPPEKVYDRNDWVEDGASTQQHDQITNYFRQGLEEGALGLGFHLATTPGTRPSEMVDFFTLAKSMDVPAFVHFRSLGYAEPVEGASEMISSAEQTGVSVHLAHIGSSGLWQTNEILELLREARASSIDVTSEVYPYTAAGTNIGDPHVSLSDLPKIDASIGDIEWAKTGERLTEETFKKFRESEPAGMILLHIMKDEDVDQAIREPGIMIASDQLAYVEGRSHPRGAGTHARVLGRYVREKRSLTLMDALEKMAFLPARRLEQSTPQMKVRGRLQEGMIADITIFDPNTVIDKATFQEPALPSEGIAYVLVSGEEVVSNYEYVSDVFPGRAIRRPAKISD